MIHDDPIVRRYRLKHPSRRGAKCVVVVTATNKMFVLFNDALIAQRGRGRWVSLEPGYEVFDGPNLESIVVHYRGSMVQ
jgi:hypothetical protein